MTSLVPRTPYTDEELRRLYPDGLELRQVQILMRHGERTPVSARFQNTGLRPFWPYCASVRQMKTAIMAHGGEKGDAPFGTLEWKRRLETFGRETHRVGCRLVNADDPERVRRRPCWIDGERHDIADLDVRPRRQLPREQHRRRRRIR